MNLWKTWTRCYLLSVFCCYYLFLLTVASPLPLNQTSTLNDQSCSLNRHHFRRFAFKNMTYTVAREARVYDQDTVNRFVGQDLYINVTTNERCYLMKRVTDTVTHVLHDLKNPNPNFLEVIYFFAELTRELRDCKPLEDTRYIEGNLKRMKDKLEQLGDNGMNKMVGELDLLYEYLRDACTSKKASSGHKDKKNKESSKL
ncbi:interleukin-22 isoform X1 [Pantherophis guttatus]|uniref:Interleukin-22 isoform X1 n=1 Tax=Pantherophis guttatus TaxID=94885 RepID=A0A6P9ATK9_PANGU|nr:interleukin-22 isoform X1 [Pantherophis guttatus]XP_060550648.1 interleukin-22 isoform X1 [Pantherophis guttatus]XP_060550649.1 interleukin-22 isoform X1 [Pantherophis guttatus]